MRASAASICARRDSQRAGGSRWPHQLQDLCLWRRARGLNKLPGGIIGGGRERASVEFGFGDAALIEHVRGAFGFGEHAAQDVVGVAAVALQVGARSLDTGKQAPPSKSSRIVMARWRPRNFTGMRWKIEVFFSHLKPQELNFGQTYLSAHLKAMPHPWQLAGGLSMPCLVCKTTRSFRCDVGALPTCNLRHRFYALPPLTPLPLLQSVFWFFILRQHNSHFKASLRTRCVLVSQ